MVLIHRSPPIYLLSEELRFPDVRKSGPDGLAALSVDLWPERVEAAYRAGLFPWFRHQGYTYWYSPDPRMILYPAKLHISNSLRRRIASGRFEIRVDTAFEAVMRHCALVSRRDGAGTWIDEYFVAAYGALFEQGKAMSVETCENGVLVGGLYGVRTGRLFSGESMFALRPDASKVALAYLCAHADAWGIELIDCQVPSDHLRRMGGEEVSREEYLALLERWR